ncbi:MAG: 3-isopropylmalate dehydratase small subunit [Betaproteobacteria bacterium]|nr:3-isopropylmalate dehydratase small subunit [Betaproteobacteria bacterium]
MDRFTRLTAVAVPIDMDNVDNDQVFPARLMRKSRRDGGYGRWLFHDLRFNEDGGETPDFVLNRSAYRKAKIIVAAHNYACGSSRIGAVYTHYDYGIRVVVATSFGDVFFNNCFKNGILPVRLPSETTAALRKQLHQEPGATLTVDLEQQLVTDVAGIAHPFEVDSFGKRCLLEGLSDIALTLERERDIAAFEARHRRAFHWLSSEQGEQA